MITQLFENGARIVYVNGEWVPCFGGGISGGHQSSESQQRSGLLGSAYDGPATAQAYGRGVLMNKITDELASSPGATMNMGRQMLGSGKYGLGENADAGVEALGNYQFGQQSKNLSLRGQNTPENMSSVVGSSIQNMLPFLIPQMQQHQYAQFQAPQSLLSSARAAADYWSRSLGSQGSSNSSGFNFGILS